MADFPQHNQVLDNAVYDIDNTGAYRLLPTDTATSEAKVRNVLVPSFMSSPQLSAGAFGANTPAAMVGDPVNSSTGNFVYDHADLRLNTKGPTLEFIRTYNSFDAVQTGPLGRGWRHNYQASLAVESPVAVTVTYPDSRQVRFLANGTYYNQAEVKEVLRANGDGTHTLILSDQTKYIFDNPGRLSEQVDKYGNRLVFQYNAGGLLENVNASETGSLTFTYNAQNRIQSVADSAGRQVSFGYANGNLTTFTDARSKTTTYGYDVKNQLTSIREPGATKPMLTNVYGAYESIGTTATGFFQIGRVTTQTDAYDQEFLFSYDKANRKTTMVDNRRITRVHEYDDNYRLTRATDPYGNESANYFMALDKPYMSTAADGAADRYVFDDNGNPVKRAW